MDRALDQLRFHPWTAVLGGLAFVVCLVLIGRRDTDRVRRLPAVVGLALFTLSLGTAASAQGIVDLFHGLALVGSAGEGTLAAGLAECLGALLLGVLPAFLTLAAGLLFLRSAPVDNAGEAEPESVSKPMSPWMLLSATLVAASVAALVPYDLWFIGSIPHRIAKPLGSVAEVSQSIAFHLNLLRFASLWAVLASITLIVLALVFSRTRPLPPHRVLWSRALLAVLLMLCAVEMAVAWRQFAHFEEAAMIGKLS